MNGEIHHMTHGLPGTFTVIDGLDGIGKGEVLKAIALYLESLGMRVFNVEDYWQTNHIHPEFEQRTHGKRFNTAFFNLDDFDVLLTSEPTHTGIGRQIRYEMIANNGRSYSAHATAEAYALDRLILYKRVLLPALRAGKHIVQGRSFSTSIVYQRMQAQEQHERLALEEIMGLEGNAFALQYAPDLLIIPTIKDVTDITKRLEGRDKRDDAMFETLPFQLQLKPFYEGAELREIFEQQGTGVEYIDAGISVAATRQQAVEVYWKVLGDRIRAP